MKALHSYKGLFVWQRSIELVTAVYELTEKFPKEEIYGLTAQMRRAAVSISSNIAEGRSRGTKKEFAQFLRVAYGSGAELETQLEIAQRLGMADAVQREQVAALLLEAMKMLNAMIRKFNPVR